MRINFLNVGVDDLSHSNILENVGMMVKDKKPHQLVTLNPEMVVLAQKDEEFRKIINQADLVIADGTGIPWAVKVLTGKKIERIPGADLVTKLKGRIFLLGGEEGIARKAGERLKELNHDIDVVGTESGGVITNEKCVTLRIKIKNEKLIQKINQVKSDILLVAFGHGKQEKWIYYHKDELNVPVMIGVGGTLDYLAGTARRAPKFLRQLGLEWLWRLFFEPKRWHRIYTAVIKFPILVIKAKILKA